MRHPDFDIQDLIDSLQGTADSLGGALENLYPGMELEDLNDKDHFEIDNTIFLCDECGWWCEISENAETDDSDEMICQDCANAR